MNDTDGLGLPSGEVRVVAHDQRWASSFRRLRAQLRESLSGVDAEVEHVGSTSVAGLAAKPLLDVAVGAHDRAELDRARQRLVADGWDDQGDWGSEGGIRLLLGPPSARVAIIHLVTRRDPQWERYLAFRDLLAADPWLRRAYGDLKVELAARHPSDRRAYLEGKRAFIESAIADTDPSARPCPACGFSYDETTADDMPDLIVDTARSIAERLTEACPQALIVRAEADRWSPLEYACHLRDVLLAQRERLFLARRLDEPVVVSMGPDERVDHDAYREQAPADVARQLRDAAELFVGAYRRTPLAERSRRLVYDYPTPARRTLRWLALHTAHELCHHQRDIAYASPPDPVDAAGG